jgi:hypothetical protein
MKHTIRTTALVLSILGVAFLAATAATAAKVPEGRTYFVVSIGVATDEFEAYELDAGCLTFTATEICDNDEVAEDCGTWRPTSRGKQTRKQKSFEFEFSLIDDETGLPVEIEGQGRIDTRGRKSSIGGVAQGLEPISGVKINFAMAGRAVGAARCARLVEEFEAGDS